MSEARRRGDHRRSTCRAPGGPTYVPNAGRTGGVAVLAQATQHVVTSLSAYVASPPRRPIAPRVGNLRDSRRAAPRCRRQRRSGEGEGLRPRPGVGRSREPSGSLGQCCPRGCSWGSCGTRSWRVGKLRYPARRRSSWTTLGEVIPGAVAVGRSVAGKATSASRWQHQRFVIAVPFPLPYILFYGAVEYACWTMAVRIDRGSCGTRTGRLRDPSGSVAGPKREGEGTDRGSCGTEVGKLRYSDSPRFVRSGERRWTLPRSRW